MDRMAATGGKDFKKSDNNARGTSEADAKPFDQTTLEKLNPDLPPSDYPVVLTRLNAEKYHMGNAKRGKCVIFNNRVFEPHTKLNERQGTDEDETSLRLLFSELGFEIIVHNDLSRREMLQELAILASQFSSEDDCFVCCILTHGENGSLYSVDGGKIPVDDVLDFFRGDRCANLAGKPKLFFIQACRGDRVDKGVPVDMADSGGPTWRIPTHADFLVAYSTVPGFCAWRNRTQGSWFVQALCCVLQERSELEDMASMLTVVCRLVAFNYESYTPENPALDGSKQVPCVTSTLTRRVYFSRREV